MHLLTRTVGNGKHKYACQFIGDRPARSITPTIEGLETAASKGEADQNSAARTAKRSDAYGPEELTQPH
jgi:hypothetical protein